MKEGNTSTLPDGKQLFVQQKTKWIFINQLEILLDGKPISGSDTDPHRQLKTAYQILMFLALFNIGIGLFLKFTRFQSLEIEPWGLIIFGSIFLLLTLLIKNIRFANVALYIAITLLVIDIVLTFVNKIQTGNNNGGTAWVMVKLFFILHFANGIQASRKIRMEQSDSVSVV